MSTILGKRPPKASGTGVGSGSSTKPDHYRNPIPLTSRSKETADRRCYEGVPRCRERVIRLLPSLEIMSGRHHRPYQTLRGEFLSNNPSTPLTDAPQESKDVEDKLGSLTPWLTKLRDSVTKGGADCTHEEAERRDRLTRFVLYLRYLADLNQSPAGPWKAYRSGPRSYKGKAGLLGSSIKRGTLKELPTSLRIFDKRSSSIRWVLTRVLGSGQN